MRSQFKGIDMDIVRDYRDHWSGGISSAHISDFPIYASRLGYIHQRMTDWRPLQLLDLRYLPYRDPISYYGLGFAIVSGIVSSVSLIVSIVSLKIAFNGH
jgi:hypothetical protein